MSILRTMDDVPFKYVLDNNDKNDPILNKMENKDLDDTDSQFEKYRMKERSFLQNNFDILNPPNL
jgi:hypothetical protein